MVSRYLNLIDVQCYTLGITALEINIIPLENGSPKDYSIIKIFSRPIRPTMGPLIDGIVEL